MKLIEYANVDYFSPSYLLDKQLASVARSKANLSIVKKIGRSETNLKAITDMLNTLVGRLDAAENGIVKLSSLVEDMITETPELKQRHASKLLLAKSIATDVMTSRGPTAGGHEPPIGAVSAQGPPGAPAVPGTYGPTDALEAGLGPGFAPGQANAPGMYGAPGPYEPPPAMTKLATCAHQDPEGGFHDMEGDVTAIVKNVQDLRDDLDNLYETFYNTMEASGIEAAESGKPPSQALANSMAEALKNAEKDPMLSAATRGGFRRNPIFDPSEIHAKIFELDKKITQSCEDIDRNTSRWQDKINRLEDQVDYVLKQMGINTIEIKSSRVGPDVAQDLQALMQLFETVQGIQEQLKQVHDTAMMLASEKEQRQHHINTLLEQIELLKTIKMDREDVAEAIAEKADLRMLARKVSHDQFEIACDDLAKGLEHAIGKLNLQEALWQQALDDIQRAMEVKLDRMELSPVKDFFNNKLKMLQDNLKQLAQLRREVEAAGTKRKLLRDVNCISCDVNAVMAMENGPCLPGNKPLMSKRSIKPYLTYELDSIRKTQTYNMSQRNMHHWEAIDRKMSHQKPPQRVRSDTDKHICNRYCGGSHTVTTPAQRVARVGHFVKQWGPDVLPLSSGLAAGDDGKMYKVTNVQAANVGPGGPIEVCTARPERKSSDTRPARSIVIANECRCLKANADPASKDGGNRLHTTRKDTIKERSSRDVRESRSRHIH